MTTPGSRMRGPRRDATENRQNILTAAAAALNEDPDASIESIASEAGLSRRALYGHFPTRDELVEAVLVRGAERVGALLEPIAHPDARIEIALFAARLWAEVSHVRVMAALAVRAPHAVRVASALEPARARLRGTVLRGAADGTLRADIPPDTLARLIEAAAIGVLDEATRTSMSTEEGHRLAMLSALSTSGLGWREADVLIASTPGLSAPQTPSAPPPTATASRATATRRPEQQ
ncbi:MAG TPA: TetR/AcrR family transcriptional regulator [Humibacter sp.]|nr:TetR/AcrR family transcriptional regulator [Humibacter sp.]